MSGKHRAHGSDKAVFVEGLTKTFGAVKALRGISFEVGRGEVLGLLGPNGAGKTTTVDILSTLTTPDTGTVLVAGHDVRTDPAGVRRSIMLTGQHVALDPRAGQRGREGPHVDVHATAIAATRLGQGRGVQGQHCDPTGRHTAHDPSDQPPGRSPAADAWSGTRR